jgi:hypothetical protein
MLEKMGYTIRVNIAVCRVTMDLLLEYVAVLTPMSRPPESSRGPPEFPLFIEASVCKQQLLQSNLKKREELNWRVKLPLTCESRLRLQILPVTPVRTRKTSHL